MGWGLSPGPEAVRGWEKGRDRKQDKKRGTRQEGNHLRHGVLEPGSSATLQEDKDGALDLVMGRLRWPDSSCLQAHKHFVPLCDQWLQIRAVPPMGPECRREVRVLG